MVVAPLRVTQSLILSIKSIQVFIFSYDFSFLKLSLASCSEIFVHVLGILGLSVLNFPYLCSQYSISSVSYLLKRKPQKGAESSASSGRISHEGKNFLKSNFCQTGHCMVVHVPAFAHTFEQQNTPVHNILIGVQVFEEAKIYM